MVHIAQTTSKILQLLQDIWDTRTVSNMDLHRIISSSSLRTRAIIIASSEISSWEKNNIIFFKPKGFGVGKCLILPSSGSSFRQGWQSSGWGAAARKETRCIEKLSQEPNQISKKQGTVAGAVALIVGTSIGSGILALPKKTSPAVIKA